MRLPRFRPDKLNRHLAGRRSPPLVIGHRDDPSHPYEIAEAYADTIPSATLRTVPSKDADPARFAADISTASSANCEHTVTVSTAQAHGRPRGAQSARVYIVVDLGGTQTRTAVFDSSGQMLTRRAIATPRTGGPAVVIAAILDQIREAVAQHPGTVVAAGVSALGTVESRTGLIRSAPTLASTTSARPAPPRRAAAARPGP